MHGSFVGLTQPSRTNGDVNQLLKAFPYPGGR